MSELTEFMRLFKGRQDAYGVGGKGGWVKHPPTSEAYMAHLEGRGSGLGIAPLLDDGTVWFAAIDLDEPNFEAAGEMQKMLDFATTWIERSRSGNAHVWTFFEEPIEAWIARGVLRETTAAIGKPAVEVFPKQDKLRDGMYGNYINLPYHGKDRPILVAVDRFGGLELEYDRAKFLNEATANLNSVSLWKKRADWLMLSPPDQRQNDSAEFGTGQQLHICAEHIIANRDENPIQEGHRNVVYFCLAKMLAHYEGFDHDEALDILRLVRDSADEKGVGHFPNSELSRILQNAERGQFTSTGCDDPLMSNYISPECKIGKL